MPKALLIRLRILWLALMAPFQLRWRPTDCEDVAEMKTDNCRIPASHGALCSSMKFGIIWINLMKQRATSSSPTQKDHKNVLVKRVIPIRPKKGNGTVLLYVQPSLRAGLKIWLELWPLIRNLPRLLHSVTLSDVWFRDCVTLGAPCKMQIEWQWKNRMYFEILRWFICILYQRLE